MRKNLIRQLSADYKSDRSVIAMVTAIIMLRLLFIFLMGPMPQDAYYFFYSQHPALSYFDHPPMIAYILRFFTTIFGRNVIALKLADSSVTIITIVLFYQLSQCFLGVKSSGKAVLLLLSTFMVTILSLVSTPDTPLLLCWVLSLYLLYQAIFRNKNCYWIWAGIAMGLAFDSKYTGIFLPAGLVLFLLFSNTYRHKLISREFWIAALLFLVILLPVFIWNFDHDFASFKFQSISRMSAASGMHFELKYFFGLLGHQSFIIIPFLLITILYFVFRILKKYRFNFFQLPSEKLFLLCFFLPLMGSFTLLSFFYWIKLNWLMPGYLTGIILVSIYMPKKWVSYQVMLSLFLHVVFAIEILFYPVPIQSDDTWYGWEELGKQVTQLKKTYPDTFVFSADGYKTSAELNLMTSGFTYSQNIIGENALQFDYVNANLQTLKGKNALYIDSAPHFTNENKEALPTDLLLHYFRSVQELKPIIIRRNGQAVRKFLVYYCSYYR